MSEQTVYDEIKAERDYQDTKWGHGVDDTLNTPNDYVAYIAKYASQWFPGGVGPVPKEAVEAFRKSMVKTAALAVAAVESLDRQTEQNGKPFYQAV